MTRLFSTFGLGIVFLAISPELRETMISTLSALQQWLAVNSPASYVGVGVLVVAGMMFGMHRAAQPRL